MGHASDIDLIVIKDTDKKFLDRLDEIYKDVTVAMNVSIHTAKERMDVCVIERKQTVG